MAAYAIVEVEVHDIADFVVYQTKVASLLKAAGARYLARGGDFRVYAGAYDPGRILLMEFPSMESMDAFYASEDYQALGRERDACSNCRIIAVQGV